MDNTPKNLHEAINELKNSLSEKKLEELKKVNPEGFSTITHFGSARKIRNDWKLWSKETQISKWFIKQGIQHPDDKSGILITSLIRDIQGKPIKLEEQIEKYRNHWKNYNQDPDDLMNYDVSDVLNDKNSSV